MNQHHHNRRHDRNGIATLWVILWVPVLLVLGAFVFDLGNIWLARVELENGLEAAALAAVKDWGDHLGSSTLTAREIGVEYAAANSVIGVPIPITSNFKASHQPNHNKSCDGNLIFGTITTNPPAYVFDATVEPDCDLGHVLPAGGGNAPAVHAQAAVEVQSIFCHMGGVTMGPYVVTARTTAMYDCDKQRAKLIRIKEFICP